MNTSDPIHQAVFSLLPHFGITGVTDVEDGLSQLRSQMARMKTEEPERYQAVLSQALDEVKTLSDVLNEYSGAIKRAKSE